MNIDNIDIKTLKQITKSYSVIHGEMNDLEADMIDIKNRQSTISNELKDLRELEISLINKIETDSGEKVTQEILTEIINS